VTAGGQLSDVAKGSVFRRHRHNALTGDPEAWVGDHDGEVLGTYSWELLDEDGDFDAEGWVWRATRSAGGRRIVLFAVLDGDVAFVAESQTGGPLWKLERQWGHTKWARLRMPRTFDQLEELADEVIAWVATVAAPRL
jgi:hypothetical protein